MPAMLGVLGAALVCGHRAGTLARGPSLARTGPVAATTGPVAGRSMLQVSIQGVGAAAPPSRVTNGDLETVVDTSDAWISKRTGIRSRHLLGPEEHVSALATDAAAAALADAGCDPLDVELVIVATSSPDDLFGDAAFVASQVGASRAVAFDLTAACSGFLFALVTASQFVHTGAFNTALVVGADALSRWVDWDDRNTCVLFGDGAGAVVVRKAGGEGSPGVLGFAMRSDGGGRCDLNLAYSGTERGLSDTAGSVSQGAYRPIAMNGKEVYKFACSRVPEVLEEALANAGMEASQVDHLLLHQANIRIIEGVASRLGISMDKVIANLDEYGNTSAASIPLALAAAVKEGKVKPGDVIACAGFGAGLSWGAAIVRWG